MLSNTSAALLSVIVYVIISAVEATVLAPKESGTVAVAVVITAAIPSNTSTATLSVILCDHSCC